MGGQVSRQYVVFYGAKIMYVKLLSRVSVCRAKVVRSSDNFVDSESVFHWFLVAMGLRQRGWCSMGLGGRQPGQCGKAVVERFWGGFLRWCSGLRAVEALTWPNPLALEPA